MRSSQGAAGATTSRSCCSSASSFFPSRCCSSGRRSPLPVGWAPSASIDADGGRPREPTGRGLQSGRAREGGRRRHGARASEDEPHLRAQPDGGSPLGAPRSGADTHGHRADARTGVLGLAGHRSARDGGADRGAGRRATPAATVTTSSAADTASTPLESRYGAWVATFAPASGPIEVSARGLPPEQSSRNGHTVVFDGLLQNAEDLRAELMPAAAEAASNADLVALAYDRWGADVPDRLRGTWLLAVWDEKRRELLCARDPLGLYPAYYAERDGELLLSPSVEALAGDGRVSSAVNRAALADHLCHRWPMLEETYYEAVKRLPGGYRLTVGADGKTLERYWDLPEQDERLVGGAGDEEQERFDELLEQAVARCLPGPTGIYLSGGLDSVSVAALATELADRSGLPRPYALSLVFEHETCNEESVQRDVARRLGLEQTILPVRGALGGRSLLESALEMSAERPAPMLNLWSPAYRYLALDARRRGREVILTGNGGDEWLEFPVKFAATLIRRGDILRLYRIWQSMQRSYPLSKSRVAWNLLWTFGTRPLLGSGGRAFLQR